MACYPKIYMTIIFLIITIAGRWGLPALETQDFASLHSSFIIFHHFPHFPPCSHGRVISLWGGKFVERHVYSGKGGKSEKTKTKGANSKNMFSVACHEGKMQYLRSL